MRLATALEIYVSGSLNVFNHETNVDLNRRLVCLDLKKLGAGLRTIDVYKRQRPDCAAAFRICPERSWSELYPQTARCV